MPNLITQETVTVDNLISGDFPRVTKKITVLTGQNVVRGTVMGRITASDKFVKSLAASSDDSEIPLAIMAEDVDATSEDKIGIIYLSGQFNKERVTFGTGHTYASTVYGLRDLNIYLEEVDKNGN